MKNKTYDILKWGSLIAIPATATLCGTVLPELGVENTETIVTVITAVGTFLGALIGVTTLAYYKTADVEGNQTELYIEDGEE